MARAITDEQRRQWASVYAQTLALAEFFGRQRPELVTTIAGYAQPSPPVATRLRGLRVARNDFLEWAGYLGGDELRALDQHE